MNTILKRCLKCGALVEVLKDCKCEDCGIQCCGQAMQEVKANTVECAVEKHLPQVEVAGNYVIVTVNHVMEAEHYIEWVGVAGENVSARKFFKPNDTIKAVFPYIKGSCVYAYCNKHGLWSTRVE